MIELLKLCGFEPDEAELQLPRITEVFNRVGIAAEDIEQAKQRLNRYYDMELQGVRKMLRLYIKGLADLVLAREEGKTKIIYGFMAAGVGTIGSALMSKSKEVYAASPAQLFQYALGCIFGKLVPILEAAEKKWVKAGAVAHCANVKTLVGLFALDLIPKPDLLVTSDFLCETAPKTIDLLQELYDIPTCCCGSCKDIESMADPNAKQVIDLAVQSMRELSKRLQDVVGLEITDDMLWEVMDAREGFGDASLKVHRLIESSDPLPMSSTHQVLYYRLGTSSSSVDDVPSQTDAMNTLYEELQERVKQGVGAVEKGAPRILGILPAHESDPRLEQLLDEVGIATVAPEGRFYPPDGRRTLGRETPKDPYEVLCSHLYTSMYQTPKARVPILIEVCKRLKVDGVLNRYHAGCRSVAGDAFAIKDGITRELGIPVLSLEWENFDPRCYDHEQYKKRFEVFKTMLLSRKADSA